MVLKVLDNLSSNSVVRWLNFRFDKAFLGASAGYKGNIHLLDREIELLKSSLEGVAPGEGLPLTEPQGLPKRSRIRMSEGRERGRAPNFAS